MSHRRRMPGLRTLVAVAVAGLVALGGPTVPAPSAVAAPPSPAREFTEPYRPQVHFSPAKNWMNDPNGLVYYQGEYHLFFQYNPNGLTPGDVSWGHAVSTDLVHWTELPVAIPFAADEWIFSGSTVVDTNNTTGFGTRANPPMVAIYTSHQPQTGIQTQSLAYSVDRGRTWTKYAGNPVIPNPANEASASVNFRDPQVQWYAPAKRWVMSVALSDQQKVQFYTSTDLKHWKLGGEFADPAGLPGLWETPDLFPLKVDGNRHKIRWVLVIGGRHYYVGSFDGKTFTPDSPDIGTVDYGMDYYASVSWNNAPRNQRIQIGWMNSWYYAFSIPTTPWRGAQSIPRTLSLKTIDGKIQLLAEPVDSLTSLRRGRPVTARRIDVPAGDPVPVASGQTLDISADFSTRDAKTFGFVLRSGNGQETRVGYNTVDQTVFVDRTKSGRSDFSPFFAGVQTAPLPASTNGRVHLRIVVDTSSVEVFAGDSGQAVITDQIFPDPDSAGVQLFSEGGTTTLEKMKLWHLVGYRNQR